MKRISTEPIISSCKYGSLKVIFILCSRKAGGAERHLLQLMEGLTAKHVECIYAGPADGWLGENVRKSGFKSVDIPFSGIFDVFSVIRLCRLIRNENVNLVHGHLTRGAYYAGWATRLSSIPSIATAHSTNAGKRFGHVTRIIAVADAVRDFLIECGYPENRIRTIHNGIPDLTKGQENNADSGQRYRNGEEIIILMAARFLRAKGQDIALHALKKLNAGNCRLILAGSLDTSFAIEMQALAKKLDIDTQVCFVGHVEDVASLYACTDILIAPSRREAFSLTLLEAAAFQLPIIAADVGGISEAIIHDTDGETGILISPEDPDALANAMSTLILSPDRRKAMGTAGRQRYLNEFTLESMTNATFDVYCDALGADT